MSAATETTQAVAENVLVEIVCVRAPLGSIAARCGISAVALRNALRRQGGARATPRLHITLNNQAIVDSAIRRAVISALSSD
jgi:hypothetical protein